MRERERFRTKNKKKLGKYDFVFIKWVASTSVSFYTERELTPLQHERDLGQKNNKKLGKCDLVFIKREASTSVSFYTKRKLTPL